ncbi:MAG: DUF2523 family protein [Bacteroidota bacterium]
MAIVWAFILTALPSLLKFLFTFLGVAFVSFTALDFVVLNATSIIFSNYNNLGTDTLAIMQLANVDTAINIILSSYTAGIFVKTTLSSTTRIKFN